MNRKLKFKKGKKNLLQEAYSKLLEIYPDEYLIQKYSDNFGTYAIETKSFILVAKSYVYNGIVSAHSQAVYHAWAKGKPLLMFIKHSKVKNFKASAFSEFFYQFDPDEVFSKSFENMRGSITMLNWKVDLAKKVFWKKGQFTYENLTPRDE